MNKTIELNESEENNINKEKKEENKYDDIKRSREKTKSNQALKKKKIY